MKRMSIHLQNKQLINRISSCIWAASLLIPLPVIAGACNNQYAFHLLLFITGWLAWAYTEYFFHRFIMHESNAKKGIAKLLNHHHHHADPHDIRVKGIHRILMTAGCILTTVIAAIFNNYTTLFCGYMTGFTAYSYMHVMLHHKWSEKLFPHLHRFHIAHHCKHPDKCFGVITTWWDHLFGTVQLSETGITERVKQFYYKPADKSR